MHPRYPWPKGSKKTIMQPCGLRNLACPRGRRSFGLKTGRVAGYARGTLAERALKNIHTTLRAAGFGASLGATIVWPQDRASCGLSPRHLGPKGSKKHSCNPAGCGIWRTLGGDGRLASRPGDLRTVSAAPWPKGSKKHSCNLAGCGIWRALGGDFRLASKPSGLWATPAVAWPKRL